MVAALETLELRQLGQGHCKSSELPTAHGIKRLPVYRHSTEMHNAKSYRSTYMHMGVLIYMYGCTYLQLQEKAKWRLINDKWWLT